MRRKIEAVERLSWPIKIWPEVDQILWAQANAPQSLLEDDGGDLAELATTSREKYAKGWGRWLSFLDGNLPNAMKLRPAERCNKVRLQAYIDHLRRSGNSESSIVNRLGELKVVASAMDPTFDPRLLNRLIAILRTKARPVRTKSHIRPTYELVDLGLRLIASATDPKNSKHAISFRDGLVIGFLALHPVRLRNLKGFELGRNLIRQGEGYMVTFAGSETKNGTPYEVPLADILFEPMNAYLRIWRPILVARKGRWTRDIGPAVWVSADGSPMSREGLSGRIELRTRTAFGKAINPHAFRDAAATTLVIADPARIRAAAPLLGHRSLATTEKHYIQAKGLEAQRSYLAMIKDVRDGK